MLRIPGPLLLGRKSGQRRIMKSIYGTSVSIARHIVYRGRDGRPGRRSRCGSQRDCGPRSIRNRARPGERPIRSDTGQATAWHKTDAGCVRSAVADSTRPYSGVPCARHGNGRVRIVVTRSRNARFIETIECQSLVGDRTTFQISPSRVRVVIFESTPSPTLNFSRV